MTRHDANDALNHDAPKDQAANFALDMTEAMMTHALEETLLCFDGIEEVEIEACEVDEEDGGVFPESISIGFSPTSAGFHALEFIAWAFGDIQRGGAKLHFAISSPPPWLNSPGRSLSFVAYVNPRSKRDDDAALVAEVRNEVEAIVSFLADAHRDHWPACRAHP